MSATSPGKERPLKYALLSAALLIAFVCKSSAQHEQHRHDSSEKLGDVNFVTSCAPQVQKEFNHAVAWLHSFEYEEAEKTFSEIAATDPKCGMAYWGVAMSSYHPLWAAPTGEELQRGWSAIEKAKSTGARTQRE